MSLSDYSIQELEYEITKRKRIIKTRPYPLGNVDREQIIFQCEEYLDSIVNGEYADEDFRYYLYEEILKSIYGENIFKFINSLNR